MAWTRDSVVGILTHSGTAREFWLLTETLPLRAEIRVTSLTTAGNVKIAVRTSADGGTCFECGIEGTQLVIREYAFGALLFLHATIAHGITAGQSFRIRVRLDGNVITAYAGDVGATEVSVSHTSTSLKGYSTRMGVVSATNNATVTWAEWGEIVDEITTIGEVGVKVTGGSVYRSVRAGQWEPVPGASNIFPPSAKLGMAALLGEMFIIGGGLARRYAALTNSLSLWTPTPPYTLPGQTGPGTTTANLIREHLGGLVLAEEGTITITGTKLNDPNGLDTAERLFGSAYVVGVGRSATVGDGILALDKGPGNSLFIACTNSVNYMIGDPYRGTHEIRTASETVGASGRHAVLRITGPNGAEMELMHAPEGFHVVPVGGGPVNLSEDVLSRYLTFPRADRNDTTVVLLRDPSRSWLIIFIDDGTGGSKSLIYDESVAKYRKGSPGYYPITLPIRVTCAGLVRGVPLFGTTDGRLCRFDVASTDLGTNTRSLITMALLDEPPADNDTIFSRPRLILGLGCGTVEMTVYAGVTPEEAYDLDLRERMAWENFEVKQYTGVLVARGPFLVATLENDGADGEILNFERMEAWFDTAALSTTRGWEEPAAAEAFCSPPVSTDPAPNPSNEAAPSGNTGPDLDVEPPTEPPPPPPHMWPLAVDNERQDVLDLMLLQAGYFPTDMFRQPFDPAHRYDRPRDVPPPFLRFTGSLMRAVPFDTRDADGTFKVSAETITLNSIITVVD